MLKLKNIRRAHVELTTRCNARCPMCMRNYRGYDFNSGYPVTELRLEDFKKIFSPNVLKQLQHPPFPNDGFPHVRQSTYGISFNGNLGDFALAKDGAEIVKYIVDHGVEVYISTNGSQRSPDWWAQLALPDVRIGFALDGLADTHHLYRQDTDWHKVIENAKAFIAAGGYALWRFVPFDHNRHQEQACKDLAKELGFAKFINIYDGRDSGPVFNRDGTFSHQIGQQPSNARIPVLKDLLDDHVAWIHVDKGMHSDKDKPVLELSCVHKRNKEIYVAADGSVYPCCFLGFYPGQMTHPGNPQLQQIVKENNALEYDLEHCLEWFDQVEESWSKPSIREGRLYHCVNNCGK